MGKFVHLHVHSEYSLLDGAARISKGKKSPLYDACKEKNFDSIALTDHGNMFGVYTFLQKFQDTDVKPIVGSEFYCCSNLHEKSKERYHLVLLAKNEKGYFNLMQLSSISYTQGFYVKPRIDIETLKKYSEGLICLSACLAGKIPQLLLQNKYEDAKNYALELKDIFDDGDFYIEIQDHGIKEQKQTNPLLVKIAREIGVKIVATNDAHYINQEDAEMHDALLCVQTGQKIDEPNRMRFDTDQFYLKTYDEMLETFSWIPEAIDNTLEVAEKCNFHLTLHTTNYLLPKYVPPTGQSTKDFFVDLTWEGINKKYDVITQEVKDRVNYELETIIELGFDKYYLIVWDFINKSKEMGIAIGPGRGSGVGSIVAYAVGITNVEPLQYSLIFERFLNKERVSMPDFDIDFCVERREETIKYVVEKYGEDKVSQIITFGTMSAKAAVKDVARVYNVSFADANKWVKAIPDMNKAGLSELLETLPELKDLYNSNPIAAKVLDMAQKLEGMPRQTGKHAAGVIICCDPISHHVPLEVRDGNVISQYDKNQIEALGLLKMDFLGLRTLTDIQQANEFIKQTHGKEIDFDVIGYKDANVYKFIASGETTCVFQLESAGMCAFMRRLQPESMEDVIAGISLYRPGPMQYTGKFIEGKKHPEKITYLTPQLEHILDVTYGCIVYQEQVMQIARDLAGYTFGGADLLRRAMGKKKKEIMEYNKKIFIYGEEKDGKIITEGAIRRGVDEKTASKLYDEILEFASYAFNKSHATAYSYVTYQTAFLKYYYPLEFVLAVINNRITNADEVSKYINHLRDIGKTVLPPNINESGVKFTIQNNCARFGLMGIKNVGEQVIQNIVDERKNGKYRNLEDFIKRTSKFGVNKRAIENMIKGGVFDGFNQKRSAMMQVYEQIMDRVQSEKKQEAKGQFSLFEMISDEPSAKIEYPDVKEYSKKLKLAYEKEVIGMYVSGHPLDDFRDQMGQFNFNTSMLYIDKDVTEAEDDEIDENGEISEEADVEADKKVIDESLNNKKVFMSGLLLDLKKKITKKGDNMAFASIEDYYGSMEIVIFPKLYVKVSSKLMNDMVVKVKGSISLRDGEKPVLRVESIKEWTDEEEVKEIKEEEKPKTFKKEKFKGDFFSVKKKAEPVEDFDVNDDKFKTICLRLDPSLKYLVKDISEILVKYYGKARVLCQIGDELKEFPHKVKVSNTLLWELEALLGKENIKVKIKK